MLIRKMTFLILAISFMLSCSNNKAASAIGKNAVVEEKTLARDLSINKSNAYNDIILDSGAVERFITAEKLNDTISTAIRSFYNTRNFEYAWFASTGLIEQSFSFRSLYSSENDPDLFNKSLENRLDRLRIEPDSAIDATDPSTIKTELQITERFVQYALKNYTSMGISIIALGNYIPSKRKNIIALADSVLVNNTINNNFAALNESYKLLKVPLQKYATIEMNGG